MSKIAIIGASGYVGTALLNEAVKRGHQVSAFVRHPEKIAANANVTAVKADVLDTDGLAALLKGHDLVISAYNPGWQEADIRNIHIKGSKSITEAVKKAGIKRLIAVGGAGSLEINGQQLVDSPEFPAEYKEGALGARQALNDLKAEDTLDWSFVSPAILLVPGEATGTFRLGKDSPVFDDKGESKITVGDLAVAILDEAEQGKHIRQRFTAAY
ncbi:NAD(P)-dependent oxidoreductase [Bacillus subtilis]|uniref:NAD(P)-dependent oxidoreductase n=1 Tax=Pseudochrobactrum asaccharolyticum TaxID=354351 RepID=UPI001F239481|nr:NAD(P)-dependent oxidoreductase [Pseudochrobactrum asaccharolyticum]MCF7645727.1 NAD(P)-dependent oxidoreductase [Pseudochrobactrum asaccharolyticum]MCF7671208.1 NAD(P)-dependent oxidoreductase [Bacillus subtilis]